MIRVEIFHAAFERETGPRMVAILDTPAPVGDALEHAYAATQNVHTNWVKHRGQFHYRIDPAPHVEEAGGARSTSVGDYALVSANGGPAERWNCAIAGWKRAVSP